MTDITDWLYLFESIGYQFYRKSVKLLWDKYPNHTRDVWDSLAIFLEGYAFERDTSKFRPKPKGYNEILSESRNQLQK